ncbi:MAG TPA: CHAT domain-containing protein, partial [Acidobacteriota bacterium]|nr:CHAT domain-containing protein [Acidobacteriota bacterium]
QIQAVSQRLYQRVVKPVRELVGNTRHLLISPDGGLNLVPFAALQDETGKYLVEQYSLTFLTSGRDLLRLKVKIPSQDPAVVVADPTYGDGTGPVLLGKGIGRLRQLDGTKAEGSFLKRLFPKAQVWMENQATKDRLKAVSKPALVHIATHGFFLEDAPKEPLNGTDFQRGITLGDTPPPVNVEQLREANPLLRSCLFFAGANGTANSTGESGTMTALEATGLDLWGTKLVVLSACDTGLGEVKNGDGVYGLRRALVLAGSEAQMMSLWPVSDEGTKELMQQYYTRLKAGEGRSEALRQVQLQMLKSKRWNHPFYWASFIQSGEWANLNGKRK